MSRKIQTGLCFLFPLGSIISIHGEMSSKIGASAILSADELCNIHYVIYMSGYGDSSSAYKTINNALKLDGVFDGGRRRSRGISLAGFNQNYIVSNLVGELRFHGCIHIKKLYCCMYSTSYFRSTIKLYRTTVLGPKSKK